jgi:hypothetical protein
MRHKQKGLQELHGSSGRELAPSSNPVPSKYKLINSKRPFIH